MLDGFLKTKFYCKCKSDIKQTRTRIGMIMRKRNATQRYLRNDASDLLRNGLDVLAFDRVEGLLVEMFRSSCLELIEQFCAQIWSNLATLDKQKECPHQYCEAVSSLMFAAARFAELPELRGLRSTFSDKYTNKLDFYVNKQLVEMFKSGHPSTDMKLQLMQDIASESGLEWNSEALLKHLCKERADGRKDTDDDSGKKVSVPCVSMDELLHEESMIHPNAKGNESESHDPDEGKPLKYRSIPPPYIKSPTKGTSMDEEKVETVKADDCAAVENNPKQGNSASKTKAVPKSVRSRHIRPPPPADDPNCSDSKTSNDERVFEFLDKGDEEDQEEKKMDILLQHYSRKMKADNHAITDVEIPLDVSLGEGMKHRSRDAPSRVTSLPVDAKSCVEETTKRHTRASSLQPETHHGNGHVHPKLPDYDNFVATLAALRGK